MPRSGTAISREGQNPRASTRGASQLRSRDPELQEKAVKFLDLMANSIFSTTVDMTDTLRQMAAQGWELSPDDIAALSPHRRDNVLRFGDYDTATLHIPPGPYDSALRLPADGL
ncbi:Tn3 family transposase [Streptomyces sp. S.PB5]|uniref:Tn3 family transposase n=1 Tax=Streptomyces sp. S.PB5 TaxID=3020844 RepID=UPI0025B1BF29|nr:Tn3 family transposase [Streptomyces sp. S.PB5]MDN3027156.1 Tn3 family transposase [Streptomyces sp. S.PB5]